MCKKAEFLKEVEFLLNSIEKNDINYWKKYYSKRTILYFFEHMVIMVDEVKRLTDENEELKQKLQQYQLTYGTKENMLKLNKKKLVDMLVASWSRENKLTHNWNDLENWLEDLWSESKDVWYIKIINKIREIRGEDINEK